jgi:hypothetical protein
MNTETWIGIGGIVLLIVLYVVYKIREHEEFMSDLRYFSETPTHDEVDDEWLLKYDPLISEVRQISPHSITVITKRRQATNSQSPVMTENDSAE